MKKKQLCIQFFSIYLPLLGFSPGFVLLFERIKSTENRNIHPVESLESRTEKKDEASDDDSYEMEREKYNKHPLNLNTASEGELMELHLLDRLQIQHFILNRKLLGP